MNTAVINIKTEPKVKSQAQKVAKELGFSLSSLVNAFLRQLVKTKRVTFGVDEEPSKHLISLMKKAKDNRKKGKASPVFENPEDAVKWLEKQGI